MTKPTHPLQDIINNYNGTKAIDFNFIRKRGDQESAFDNCIEFLKRVKRTKRVGNWGNCSGHFKHLIEMPFPNISQNFRDRIDPCMADYFDIYTGYVYKGTFYLAAKSMGFICSTDKHYPESISVRWNIAKTNMDQAILNYIGSVRKRKPQK